MSTRTTHNAAQKRPDDEPQYKGIVWPNGTVTVCWLTTFALSIWLNMTDFLTIHGHPEYGTEIVWHDAGI